MFHHSDQKTQIFSVSVRSSVGFGGTPNCVGTCGLVFSRAGIQRNVWSSLILGRTKTENKTTESQLIYSCDDLTLHLFIVCIYLFGS